MESELMNTVRKMDLKSICIATIAVPMIAFAVLKLSRPAAVYPRQQVQAFASESLAPFKPESNASGLSDERNMPLRGLTAIVTGSTSGLGKEIAGELYALGAHVVVASRNQAKCEDTIQDIKREFPSSVGSLEAGLLDTSDFDSVRKFIEDYKASHTSLHYLINNSGIHYFSNPISSIMSGNFTSKQGYDLAFATNYMGHFLLSQGLADMIHNSSAEMSNLSNSYGKKFYGRILNVASAFHFQPDGHMLRPSIDKASDQLLMPEAARSDINSFSHRRRAYGNNKLAQVLHAKEMQRRFEASGKLIKALAFCPGWTTTNILPDNLLGKFIAANGFSSKAATVGSIMALFDPKIKGGSFVTSYTDVTLTYIPGMRYILSMFSTISPYIRDTFLEIISMSLLMCQSLDYGYHIEESSRESNDSVLAKQLFEWTASEFTKKGY